MNRFFRCHYSSFLPGLMSRPKVTWRLYSDTTESVQVSENRRLRILFFGTDSFALTSLQRLHQELLVRDGVVNRLEVVCLQMKSLVPQVSQYAKNNSIPVHLWPPCTDYISQNFDLGVVASFGRLIPGRIISSFPLGMLNIHASLLPRWRGAAPIIHALNKGDDSTGVTIMRVRPAKFDIGEILHSRSVIIEPHALRLHLTHKLSEVGAELLLEVLAEYDHFNLKARPQSEEGIEVSFAPVISKDMAFIDFEKMTNRQIYNRWRAVGDLFKLRTKYKETGKTVRLRTCYPPEVTKDFNLDPQQCPGTVRFVKKNRKEKYICVKCKEGGWLAFSGIFYGDKKEMNPGDFNNGFISKPGSHKFIADDQS